MRKSFSEKEMKLLTRMLDYYSAAAKIDNEDVFNYVTRKLPIDDHLTENQKERFLRKLL